MACGCTFNGFLSRTRVVAVGLVAREGFTAETFFFMVKLETNFSMLPLYDDL